MQIQTQHNQIIAHPDTANIHVKVAIPYHTHNDSSLATAYLEPAQAKELGEILIEMSAEVRGTKGKNNEHEQQS